MREDIESISLLLVDNDPEFHRIARTLQRMGFPVRFVSGQGEALRVLGEELPDVVILDIAVGGLQTLRAIRKQHPKLPAVVIASHAATPSSVQDIDMTKVVFVARPVNVDDMLVVLRRLVSRRDEEKPREHRVSDLMVSPDLYPRLYSNETVAKAVQVLASGMYAGSERDIRTRLRSAVVYDERGQFQMMLRLNDLLSFIVGDPYGDRSFGLTGMFHARCNQLMNMKLEEFVPDELISVDVHAPLISAVQMMIIHHLINLPVMDGEEFVGVIRDKDVLADVAGEMGFLE